MGHGEPAKHDDYGERESLHDHLPVENLTMPPVIETEQADRKWPSILAMRADSPLLVKRHI
jgi:hypothetical protein